MLLTHHDLGGSGPVLLILHANSLCGQAYTPMVDMVLKHHFRCIALDAPGQGASPCLPEGVPMTISLLVDSVYSTIRHLGLIGCRVLGHSMGGSLALCVESAHPGTFHAMYLYEPPCATPTGLRMDRQARASLPHDAPSPGDVLSSLARKRRWHWPSSDAALTALTAKPPFSLWHPAAMQAFLTHGLRPLQQQPSPAQLTSTTTTTTTTTGAGQQRPNLVHNSTSSTSTSSGTAYTAGPGAIGGGSSGSTGGNSSSMGGSSGSTGGGTVPGATGVGSSGSTGGGGGAVQLCCLPTTEESVYVAFEPPPCARQGLSCPLVWAVTAAAPGLHSRLPGLGTAALEDLACMELHTFPHLSHFGPMEAPERVAQDAVDFFTRRDTGQLVRGQQRVVAEAWPCGPQQTARL